MVTDNHHLKYALMPRGKIQHEGEMQVYRNTSVLKHLINHL